MSQFATKLTCISKLVDRLVVGSGYFGILLLLVGAVAVNCDVIARYAFNRPTLWAYDVSRYMLLPATLLSAAWIFREDGHVKIDLISNRLKGTPKLVLETVTSFLGIIICAVLFYQGVMSTLEDIAVGMKTNDVLEINRFWLLMFIPIGSFLLTCQGIRRFTNNLMDLIGSRKE